MKTKLTTIIIAILLLIAVTIGHGRSSYARGIEAASIAPEKAAKPLTTDGLAITLLRLAERAEGQEMRVEAQAIRRAAAEVLRGTPAKP